ncbi:MAG: NUMOD3 domain-containing DNA-binding protein [Nanoarchaeota archaeon]
MNETRYCKCGCGKEIIIKPYHKYCGIPKYIQGHHNHLEEYKKKQREVAKNNPNFGTKKSTNELILCACGCGKTFYKYDNSHRERKYILGHNSYLEEYKGKNREIHLGENNYWFGRSHTEETLKKMRENSWMKGKHLSEERKKMISENKERSLKISKSLKGKPKSEKHKENLSISHKGKPNLSKGKKRIRTKSSEIKCDFCNKISYKQNLRITRNNFCNSGCYNKWQKGRLRPEEYKQKMKLARQRLKEKQGYLVSPKIREIIKQKRALQITPVKDTSIEVKIQTFLKLLGIEFFTHQYIKDIEHGYQCDILIPSMNMVIECDGNYWHKYPVGNEIDNIRTQELLDKGFKVLRLWESEINKMNIKEFENKINEVLIKEV